MGGTAYEIRVAGLLPADLLSQLGEVTTTEQETRTVLSGTFVDQAALHGFLQRLRALGLDLVELRALPHEEDERFGRTTP
jgi:hypothetical protein